MESETAATNEPSARLRILSTTDLHLHLLPYDYYADRARPATGLAAAARVIRRLRAEAPGACLLLDNGDTLQGAPMSDRLAAEEGPHPMIAAMNALGYDAMALGNHDLNHGLPYLRRALAQARFPVLAANLLGPEDAPLAPPSVLLTREIPGAPPLRIGVLGLAPPQSVRWDRLVLEGEVRARDILDAAREESERLRAAGADLVVALSHSGIGPAEPEPMMENAAVPLAALSGIDAVVVGHTHRAFPGEGWPAHPALDPVRGTIHGKPAVQPGAFGSHVGVIDLDLARGPGGWRIAARSARLEPVADAIDEEVAAIAATFHQALLAAMRRPVGRTLAPLRSHFALVAADPSLDVVADALRAEAARLLDGTPEAGLPVLAALSPFRAGGHGGPSNFIDIPPGPIAFRQAAGLYIHPNSFCLVEVTGAGLAQWLERSASAFLTLTPGETDQPLLDPAVPSYNFDVIDGLSWTIDPTRPPRTDAEGRVLDRGAARVSDIRHEGRPVAPGDRYALATNSYRMGGGGGFAAALAARPLAQGTTPIRDLVLAHLRTGPLDPAPRPRWRFAPHPGTAAWFDSAPAAEPPPGIEALGPAPGGFRRFRLRL